MTKLELFSIGALIVGAWIVSVFLISSRCKAAKRGDELMDAEDDGVRDKRFLQTSPDVPSFDSRAFMGSAQGGASGVIFVRGTKQYLSQRGVLYEFEALENNILRVVCKVGQPISPRRDVHSSSQPPQHNGTQTKDQLLRGVGLESLNRGIS